jgi:hypothetical protein
MHAGRVPARLTLAVLIAALVAAPPAVARDRCSPKGSKTVKQTAKVRVFTTARKGGSKYFACLRGSGRPVRIAVTSDVDPSVSLDAIQLEQLKVAGTSVAAAVSNFEDIGVEGEESWSLLVMDLRRGGRSYSASFSTEGRYAGFSHVLLRPDGAAAWIVDGTPSVDGNATTFDEIDVLGATDERATPVAYAKGIDDKSLAFGGLGVTWTQGGVARSAPIP